MNNNCFFSAPHMFGCVLVLTVCVLMAGGRRGHHRHDHTHRKEPPKAYHFPPRLIIFDLDSLVWPFWLGTELQPPVKLLRNGHIIDKRGIIIKAYPEVDPMLQFLSSQNYKMAVVARTGKEVLKLLGWDKKFKFQEIYPGPKTVHIRRLIETTGENPNHMIFYGYFVEEAETVEEIFNMTSVVCDKDMTQSIFVQGLLIYLQKFGLKPSQLFPDT